jgi:hypothetical protein
VDAPWFAKLPSQLQLLNWPDILNMMRLRVILIVHMLPKLPDWVMQPGQAAQDEDVRVWVPHVRKATEPAAVAPLARYFGFHDIAGSNNGSHAPEAAKSSVTAKTSCQR